MHTYRQRNEAPIKVKPASLTFRRTFSILRYLNMGHDRIDYSHEVRTHNSCMELTILK
ncbi:MAG: hypothetical protein WD078_16450 [Woeseia sp.]